MYIQLCRFFNLFLIRKNYFKLSKRPTFFALWPSTSLQRQLADIAREIKQHCIGKPVATHNLHLTLVFVGEVNQAIIPRLIDAAKSASPEAFILQLNRVGWFQNSKVAWIAPEQTPPELSSLANNLQQALRQTGFTFDEKPFVPHVTLLRKSGRLTEANLSHVIVWQVRGFALVQSHSEPDGVRYEVLYRFGE
jgi:RNA 2',3'-cyclic 3'-phosphodiesterase